MLDCKFVYFINERIHCWWTRTLSPPPPLSKYALPICHHVQYIMRYKWTTIYEGSGRKLPQELLRQTCLWSTSRCTWMYLVCLGLLRQPLDYRLLLIVLRYEVDGSLRRPKRRANRTVITEVACGKFEHHRWWPGHLDRCWWRLWASVGGHCHATWWRHQWVYYKRHVFEHLEVCFVVMS